MAKNSCRYNGNTNCDKTELHTWISTLAWQHALRVKHLQLSMPTQAECHWQHGLAHQDQYRQRHIEKNCSVLLPTLVSGSTLLSCDHPNHVSRNQHWNGAPFGFQCCFLFNKSRIVTKKKVNIKSQNRQLPTPQFSPKLCHLNCPWWTNYETSKYTFVWSYMLTNI